MTGGYRQGADWRSPREPAAWYLVAEGQAPLLGRHAQGPRQGLCDPGLAGPAPPPVKHPLLRRRDPALHHVPPLADAEPQW
jgi:hypothetical protein